MATINIILDTRKPRKDGSCPLKISLAHRSQMAYVSLGIYVLPSQWSEDTRSVVSHPRKQIINATLKRKVLDIEQGLLQVEGILGSELKKTSATMLRDKIISFIDNGEVVVKSQRIKDWLLPTQANKSLNTIWCYNTMWSGIERFVGNETADNLTFADIDKEWLTAFVEYLNNRGLKRNTAYAYIKNLKSVFNTAIREDAITYYPFKSFRISKEATRKRSLSVDVLATIFTRQDLNKKEKYSLDVFRLSFYLIGINIHDLYNLKKTDMIGDRLCYKRAKTGRMYDIKIYRSAKDLIEKYKASSESDRLLCFGDQMGFKVFMRKVNLNLNRLSERIGLGVRLTTYWARHSWATIASSLDIPKETIAVSLGHSQSSVTDIYINFNMNKCDDANYMVISLLDSKMAILNVDDRPPVTLDQCPY